MLAIPGSTSYVRLQRPTVDMFKTFPEFTRLDLKDKEEYDAIVRDLPPFADISFVALNTWWSALSGVLVSKLNGNIVLQYWTEGDEDNSGLSLIGQDKIDESLCVIFDYLRAADETLKLVNVPEFTVNSIRYPDLFHAWEHRRYHEYIMEVSNFYPIQNVNLFRRKKIQLHLKRIGNVPVSVKCLDLNNKANAWLLLDSAERWHSRNLNDFGKLEQEALRLTLSGQPVFNIENICFFVGPKLVGFCLYERTKDKSFVNVLHIKATDTRSVGYELISYLMGEWFTKHGITTVNLNSDMGILRLRMFMMTLGPSNFFRKYYIRPANTVKYD